MAKIIATHIRPLLAKFFSTAVALFAVAVAPTQADTIIVAISDPGVYIDWLIAGWTRRRRRAPAIPQGGRASDHAPPVPRKQKGYELPSCFHGAAGLSR